MSVHIYLSYLPQAVISILLLTNSGLPILSILCICLLQVEGNRFDFPGFGGFTFLHLTMSLKRDKYPHQTKQQKKDVCGFWTLLPSFFQATIFKDFGIKL